MISFLLIAALQPSDFVALDSAHSSWIRCAVTAAQETTGSSDDRAATADRAFDACEQEERSVRQILSRLHPEASAEHIDDVIGQFRRNSMPLVQSNIPRVGQNAVRSVRPCTFEHPYTVSLGSGETLAARMGAADHVYTRCHGRARGHAAFTYWASDRGEVRRQRPGVSAPEGRRQLLSLYVQFRDQGWTTAWLTWFITRDRGDICHFRFRAQPESWVDEMVGECFRAIEAAASQQ